MTDQPARHDLRELIEAVRRRRRDDLFRGLVDVAVSFVISRGHRSPMSAMDLPLEDCPLARQIKIAADFEMRKSTCGHFARVLKRLDQEFRNAFGEMAEREGEDDD